MRTGGWLFGPVWHEPRHDSSEHGREGGSDFSGDLEALQAGDPHADRGDRTGEPVVFNGAGFLAFHKVQEIGCWTS